jgi:hypothetical protein
MRWFVIVTTMTVPPPEHQEQTLAEPDPAFGTKRNDSTGLCGDEGGDHRGSLAAIHTPGPWIDKIDHLKDTAQNLLVFDNI